VVGYFDLPEKKFYLLIFLSQKLMRLQRKCAPPASTVEDSRTQGAHDLFTLSQRDPFLK
jgi:hypothetical protein